jgi:hypothetical protein
MLVLTAKVQAPVQPIDKETCGRFNRFDVTRTNLAPWQRFGVDNVPVVAEDDKDLRLQGLTVAKPRYSLSPCCRLCGLLKRREGRE